MEQTKTPARHRHRASAACIACRKGRIRCILNQETKTCSHCRDNGFDCVFDEKDGRKTRASAKAAADELAQRVQMLERLLRDHNPAQKEMERVAAVNISAIDLSPPGVSPPCADDHPPPYIANVPSGADEPLPVSGPASASETHPRPSSRGRMNPPEKPVPDAEGESDPPAADDSSPLEAPAGEAHHPPDEDEEDKVLSVVRKLMPSPVRFDMASGRVRYFGPTTNMNVLSATSLSRVHERRESHWPISLIVRDLSSDTHNYLMDLYWACHNAVIHLVHLDAFYYDQDTGGTQFYSTFLHLTMLATGFRYADKSRPEIKALVLPGHPSSSSSLHEKARAMARLEIDRPGGLPTIQALSLLGDLEFYSGRDDTGWMFTGMSFRMVFDAGLHVDPSSLQLTERETQIRHMTLWASLIIDEFWSLYLGRPTTFKTPDIAQSCLSFDFGKLISCRRPTAHEKKVGTRIYEVLLRLMDIVKQLCDTRPRQSMEAYFKMTAMDHQLNQWYISLPEDLRWPSPKQAIMPASYFLLHTQYHAALILLHRPFVPYSEVHRDKPDPSTTAVASGSGSATSDPQEVTMDRFKTMSRTVCAENAKRIATIFTEYRRRFDLAQVFGTGVQHAGTAATALMGEIDLQTDPAEQQALVEQLSSLRTTISRMSKNYQPAVLMTSVVDQFVKGAQPKGAGAAASNAAAANLAGQDDNLAGSRVGNPEDTGFLVPNAFPMDSTRLGVPNADLDSSGGSRKRARVDGYIFTPTGPGAASPQGLPFLPSSFLEGLNTEDLSFSDLGPQHDYGFWDSYTGMP